MTTGQLVLGALAGAMALAAAVVPAVIIARKVKISTVSWKSGKEWMENSWLAGLPSTNFKIVTTVGLYFLTFAAWAAAVLLEKPIDEFTFGLWLAFLAGAGGFALAQFNRQRATDYGAMDRQAEIERAKRGVGPKTMIDADTANVKATTVDVNAGATSATDSTGGQPT